MICTEQCQNPAVASCICRFPLPLLCEDHLVSHPDSERLIHYHLPLYARDRIHTKELRKVWKSQLLDYETDRLQACNDLQEISSAYSSEFKRLNARLSVALSNEARLTALYQAAKKSQDSLDNDLINLRRENNRLTAHCQTLSAENSLYHQHLYARLEILCESRNIVTMFAKVSETIGEVKQRVALEEGIAESRCVLLYEDTELKDERSIAECKVPGSARLTMMASMQVFLKSYDGRTLLLTLLKCNTVRKVKEYVQDRVGVDPDSQNLSYMGKLMEDKKTLLFYNVCKDSQLYMTLRVRSVTSLVFIRFSSLEFSINISLTDFVIQLKSLIQQTQSIPASQQKLLFAGQTLDDNQQLIDYKIAIGATIDLVVPMIALTVYYKENRSLELIVAICTKVKIVKQLVGEAEGVPGNKVKLVYAGKELMDEKTVWDCFIKQDSKLEMVIDYA